MKNIKKFNDFSGLNELFGGGGRFSESEKELKSLKEKIKKAKIELSKNNFADTCGFQFSGDDSELKKIKNNLLITRLNLCKINFPVLVKLLPDYFDNKQDIKSIIYKLKDKKLDFYVPSKLYKFVSDSGVLNNNKAIEKLSIELDKLVKK